MISKIEYRRYQLFENVMHGVIVTDGRGHIVFLNESIKELLGFNDEELVGRPLSILYANGQEQTFKDVLEMWAAEKRFYGRLHARKKSGEAVWLDVKSSRVEQSEEVAVRHVITLCDISMLKFARSRLKKNEAISQAIFDASVDAMIISDKDGVIEMVNQSACDMFGYEESELIGKRIDALISSPVSIGGGSYIVESLRQTRQVPHSFSREIHGLKRDETVFPIELSAAKVTQSGQIFYAGIIRDLSERRRLERRIINIGNEERVQMGRELHDGLGQMLTGIRMQSEVLHRRLKANGLPGADEVGEISNMVRDADEFARNLSRSAVKNDLDGMELCTTLDELCKRVSRMSDIECCFHAKIASDITKDDVAQNLYRIAQESITNAIKHGKPTKINVQLSSSPLHTVLIVDDDGKGFCEDATDKNNKGAGLKIMKHRARVLGGVLDITRTDDDTTRVRCIIPQNIE